MLVALPIVVSNSSGTDSRLTILPRSTASPSTAFDTTLYGVFAKNSCTVAEVNRCSIRSLVVVFSSAGTAITWMPWGRASPRPATWYPHPLSVNAALATNAAELIPTRIGVDLIPEIFMTPVFPPASPHSPPAIEYYPLRPRTTRYRGPRSPLRGSRDEWMSLRLRSRCSGSFGCLPAVRSRRSCTHSRSCRDPHCLLEGQMLPKL